MLVPISKGRLDSTFVVSGYKAGKRGRAIPKRYRGEDRVGHASERAAHKVGGFVRRKPEQAILAGAATGALVAPMQITKPRKKDVGKNLIPAAAGTEARFGRGSTKGRKQDEFARELGVSKRQRTYDAESQRQRRMGAAMGGTAIGAAWTGRSLKDDVKWSRDADKGKKVTFKPGSGKKALAATGLASTSALIYGRGKSRQNKAWT